MKPQRALEVLESLRPAPGGVTSVLAVTRDSASMCLTSTTNPTEWAVITAHSGHRFAVAVTGDFVHIVDDENADDDEILSYLTQLVDIGLRYLADGPVATDARRGPPAITVSTDRERVRLCGPPRQRVRPLWRARRVATVRSTGAPGHRARSVHH